MGPLGFFTTPYGLSVLAFLAVVAAVVWWDRRNIERHGIVFIRRTDRGIGLIDRVARLCPRIWRGWATLGVAAGFVVMVWITGLLLMQTVKLFLVADATPPVGPVLPTGSTVTDPAQTGYLGLPFWHFFLGLFAVLVVHEGMHGVISRVEGFSIESVGLLLLGPIPGAFVQPEGQKDFFDVGEGASEQAAWEQSGPMAKLRVLVAGPFSNITVALLLGALLLGVFTRAHGAPEPRGAYVHEGMRITQVVNGSPAAAAGLQRGMVMTRIDGQPVPDIPGFQNATDALQPGQQLRVATQGNGTFTATLAAQPEPEGNRTYQPAVLDHALPALEQAFPGTVTAYEQLNNIIVQNDASVRIARWRWIAEQNPALQERAQDRITALQAQVDDDTEGFLGVFVVPERDVREAWAPYIGPVMFIGQFLLILAALQFMIGAANLLPVKGLDGGWMLSILLNRVAPAREQRVTRAVTLFTVLMILTSFGFLAARHL